MSDQQVIFVLFFLFYFWECLHWIPHQVTLLITSFGFPWRKVRYFPGLEGASGGLMIESIFPWKSFALLCGSSSAKFLPSGLLIEGPIDKQQTDGSTLIPWENGSPITSHGAYIMLQGKKAWKSTSLHAATVIVKSLNDIVDSKDREKALITAFHDHASLMDLRSKWKDVRILASRLSLFATLLWVYLFAIWTPLAFLLSLQELWVPFFLGLFALTIPVGIYFRKYHRQLYPEKGDERFKQTCLMVLYPPVTMRAHSYLTRSLFETIDPWVIQSFLLKKSDALQLIQRKWRHLTFPTSLETGSLSLAKDLAWHRNQRLKLLMELATELGSDIEGMNEAPKKESSDCKSYCPRCHIQFTERLDHCPDCIGVKLSNWK